MRYVLYNFAYSPRMGFERTITTTKRNTKLQRSLISRVVSRAGLPLDFNSWTEKTLTTHDLALPLPHARMQHDSFRFLMLSPRDFTEATLSNTNKRLDRLAILSGGQNIAVLFLLENSCGSVDGLQVFLQFQA